MKKKTALFLAGATALAALGPAFADDKPKIEVLTSWTSGGEAAALGVIRSAFEKRGGDWQDSSIAGFGAADASFQNRVVAGNPPGGHQIIIGRSSEDFVKQGVLVPIDDVAKAGKWDQVLAKSVYDLISFDGKPYLVPTGAHGESWVFYRKDVFAKAGITTEPATWEELFAAFDKLKAAGILPVAWGGQSWQETKVFNMILLSQVGIDGFLKIYVDKDKSAASVDGVQKSLTILSKLRAYVDEGAPGRNWNDATAMVISGKAGVQFMGDWAKGEFTVAGLEAGKDYGCMLAPQSPGMVYIADSFSFPKLGPDGVTPAQKLLAEVVMDPKVQLDFAIKKGAIPMRSDVDKSSLDVCSQKGLALMSEGKIVPDQEIILTPQQAGALSDFVDEFWSNTSEDPAAGAEAFYGIFG